MATETVVVRTLDVVLAEQASIGAKVSKGKLSVMDIIQAGSALAKLEREADTIRTGAEQGARDTILASIKALGPVPVPTTGVTVTWAMARGEDGKLHVERAAVVAPTLPDVVYAWLGDVLVKAEAIKSIKRIVVDGTNVTLGGAITSKPKGTGGNGAGKGNPLTVDGTTYPSAADAYRKVIGEMTSQMSRSAVITALTKAQHTVS